MTQYITITLLVFIGINLINVILSTMKSILTIKSTRLVATLINAIAYGFYSLIVKQMSDFDTTIVVVVTIGTNLIGVYFSMWLLDKLKKDKIWKITVVVFGDDYKEITDALMTNEIGFNNYNLHTKYGQNIALDIFSKSQKDSKLIKDLLADYEVKYYITELNKQL